MGWKERTHELIRLGRMHHPEAVKEFLEAIQKPSYDRMMLHEAASALPMSCEGMALSILRAARLDDVQDEEIIRVIKAAAHETRDVKPLPPLQPKKTFTQIELHSAYYDAFGAAEQYTSFPS